MLALAVAAQPFTVIAGDDDDGFVVESLLLQPLQDAADLGVRESDLTVVALVRRRRLVWRVSVVKVQPGEERFRAIGVEPLQCRVDHGVRRPLHFREVEALVWPELELIVVMFEALLEAPPAVEN